MKTLYVILAGLVHGYLWYQGIEFIVVGSLTIHFFIALGRLEELNKKNGLRKE